MSWCARRGPRNKTSRKFEFSNMLDFAVCTRCMPSRRLRRLDKPLSVPRGGWKLRNKSAIFAVSAVRPP